MPKINPTQIGDLTTTIVTTLSPIITAAILPTILEQTVAVSGGITPGQHEVLNQFIHLWENGPGTGFATGAYREVIGIPFPTNITWYVDNTKSKKIIEKIIVRNNSKMPIGITWNIFNVDGITVLNSIVDTIIYTNNIFETSRMRSII
jgi:hypothetical protein